MKDLRDTTLPEALAIAYEAMNYMGNKINRLRWPDDATVVNSADLEYLTPRFQIVAGMLDLLQVEAAEAEAETTRAISEHRAMHREVTA
jgi:hypothetical protein